MNNQSGFWLSGEVEKSVHVADCPSDNPVQAIDQFKGRVNKKTKKDQYGGHWVSLPGQLCYQGIKDGESFLLCHQSELKHGEESEDSIFCTGASILLTFFTVQACCMFSCGCCCGAYWVNQC